MLPDFLRYLPGYLFIVIPGAWLFLAFYNLIICYLDRGPLKTTLRHLNTLFLLLVILLPIALAGTGPVGQALRFEPRSLPAWLLIGLLALLWLLAITGQIITTHGLLRPRTVWALRGRSVKPAPYHPATREWSAQPPPYAVRDSAPCETSRPKPSPRRRIDPVQQFPLRSRMSLWPGIRAINHAYDLEVVHLKLAFASLPEKFSGLRVLLLSDLHLGRELAPGYYRHVIETARREQADMVLFAGDFTSRDNLYREAVELIARLDAPMGTYAVLGNHDYFTEPELLAYWMESCGILHLANRSVDFTEPGRPALADGQRASGPRFRLTGIEHPHKPVADWEALLRDESDVFQLVISHRPDYALRLGQAGADLVVSGHTHGGQWRLPIIGPLVVPSVYGRRYAQGLFETGQSLLYTSRGCGLHTIPIRFRCPPEITVLELVSEKKT